MDFIPDCNAAREMITRGGFNQYSAAYVATNEVLKKSMQFMPKNCNRVLSVAASGDHPLFCSMRGAKYVDTFDVSYNAKCIMDIKIAALKCLTYSDYLKLLKDLWICDDIGLVPAMYKIAEHIPAIEWEYICSMSGFYLFGRGIVRSRKDLLFPNAQEYKKLQKTIDEPYNFIMCDVNNLEKYLTTTYDFIHLSNIPDYTYSMFRKLEMIDSLSKFVNVGGRIVIQHLVNYQWEDVSPTDWISQTLKRLEQEQDSNVLIEIFKNLHPDAVSKNEKMRDDFKNWDYKRFYDGKVIVFERIR